MDSIFNLVEMTATYSNAVLVAILPHITDVAQKLELPFPTPITQSQVRRFVCDPRAGEVGGYVTLTNGYEFWFQHGYVNGVSSPWNVFRLQNPNLLPKFYGPLRMNEKEAVALARKTLKKLGYTNDVFDLVEPEVKLESPKESFAVNQGVPQYQITWYDSDSHLIRPLGALAELDINANVKHVDGYQLYSKIFWRTNPDVGVVPRLKSESDSKSKTQYIGGHRLMPVTPAYSNACMHALMPVFTDYARKLGLPINLPITLDQCANIECWMDKGEPSVQIILTNGYRFNFDHGYVDDFYADDYYFGQGISYFSREDIDKLLYQSEPTSKTEAVKIARDAISKLGYADKLPEIEKEPDNLFNADSRNPRAAYFARYAVDWDNINIPGVEGWKIEAEVDVKNKILKSLYLGNTNLWREPPKIDAPASAIVQTNSPPPQ